MGGFDQQRTDGDVCFGKVLALFDPVTAEFDNLVVVDVRNGRVTEKRGGGTNKHHHRLKVCK